MKFRILTFFNLIVSFIILRQLFSGLISIRKTSQLYDTTFTGTLVISLNSFPDSPI